MRRSRFRLSAPIMLACLLALGTPGSHAAPPGSTSAHAPPVPGLSEQTLSPAFWIARAQAPDAPLLDHAAIESINMAMRDDPSIHAPLALPHMMTRAAVIAWITAISVRPIAPRFTAEGPVAESTLDALVAALALDTVDETVEPGFGLVVRRADLRTFPSALRVFSRADDTDIDRFQEDALFPGAPVAVLHRSRDGAWLFVVSERYAAWIDHRHVALGTRAEVAGYVDRAADGLVVTGATARTVFTPEAPAVSDVQLEMGVRVPRVAWPDGASLNGQVPAYGHVVELPVRGVDGALSFAPAAIPRAADVRTAALPYTRATLIRQAFKFLGERYGWGHAYNARDCSGFVSEIFRSVGVLLPRNTGAQAVAEALDGITVAPETSRARRLQLLREADVGDLVFVPGHVMMIIGHIDGEPWVIHDTAGTFLRDDAGMLHRAPLNGVVVTPTTPLFADAEGVAMIDRITHIQRVR